MGDWAGDGDGGGPGHSGCYSESTASGWLENCNDAVYSQVGRARAYEEAEALHSGMSQFGLGAED